MLGMNVVSGIMPDNETGNEVQEMVQQPDHFSRSWFIETLDQGAGLAFGRSYNHEDFFYNFTVMSNSSDSVIFDFEGDFEYNPFIVNMILAPGESFGGNFTYIGEYGSSGTEFLDFRFAVESGGNATVIFEAILWDTYVYRMGLTGYLLIGSFAVVFVVFVIVFIRSGRKKSSPHL